LNFRPLGASPAAKTPVYVAIGDSYSSGEVTRWRARRCHPRADRGQDHERLRQATFTGIMPAGLASARPRRAPVAVTLPCGSARTATPLPLTEPGEAPCGGVLALAVRLRGRDSNPDYLIQSCPKASRGGSAGLGLILLNAAPIPARRFGRSRWLVLPQALPHRSTLVARDSPRPGESAAGAPVVPAICEEASTG